MDKRRHLFYTAHFLTFVQISFTLSSKGVSFPLLPGMSDAANFALPLWYSLQAHNKQSRTISPTHKLIHKDELYIMIN